MPDSADLVLHHLIVRGRATSDQLAEATAQPPGTVESALRTLVERELVAEKGGRLPGFVPTPTGRENAAARLHASGLRKPEAGAWYDTEFGTLNGEFKALCSAWQLREVDGRQEINDHSDALYDQRILDRFSEFHLRAIAALDTVGHPRLTRYGNRLVAAEAAVRAGDTRRFTAPLAESYHDIWMELHQDLLLSCQRTRTEADA
ncbi:MarR family transcriptional regulator [Mycobacterium sp. CVI_P3]|uniref:MarR family transcriptional regulator n=1 Tax=Mycobacterium pinniadriaticum TaxID=2994102 RepID=A0ABT3SPE7_9MYCO|nr:MarR family transcriptional regulator [Mycobacterium pinniadriaticum]MCX2934312.1 MarR family transcriptional regulator [Mycobacterium pinniadriaticum]MCX2940735.1 MarR family transcriptional regulator [Mycobacterium pinniadriaticum]